MQCEYGQMFYIVAAGSALLLLLEMFQRAIRLDTMSLVVSSQKAMQDAAATGPQLIRQSVLIQNAPQTIIEPTRLLSQPKALPTGSSPSSERSPFERARSQPPRGTNTQLPQ